MKNKIEFTNKLLKELPGDHGLTLESALMDWWQDSRADSGLRLTHSGHKTFQQLGLEHWSFEIPAATIAKPKQLIVLNRHVHMPYHIGVGKKPSITFYGSREATMYALYGDLTRFVNALNNLD